MLNHVKYFGERYFPIIVPQCKSNWKLILAYQIEDILSDINHVITFPNFFLSNALVIAYLWLIFWLETFSRNSSTAKEQPEKKQHCELPYAKSYDI